MNSGVKFMQQVIEKVQELGPAFMEKISNLAIVKNSILFRLIPQVLFAQTLRNFDSQILSKVGLEAYDFETDKSLLEFAKAFFSVRAQDPGNLECCTEMGDSTFHKTFSFRELHKIENVHTERNADTSVLSNIFKNFRSDFMELSVSINELEAYPDFLL